MKVLAGVVAVGMVLGVAALSFVFWRIHISVQEHTSAAQLAFPNPDDDVAALIAFMNDDSQSLRERNGAIWTLGQTRDPQALPALESVYDGEVCLHDENLCQYELEKAIKLCGATPDPPRK